MYWIPYDIWRLQIKAGLFFDLLLARHVRLTMVDGLVLPVLAMNGGPGETCSFLNDEGRCNICDVRPGICCIFPPDRRYADGTSRYFLQKKECKKTQEKNHFCKWINPSDLSRYEDYLCSWHAFKDQLMYLRTDAGDVLQKAASVYVLQAFYSLPWDEKQGFYEQYEVRLSNAKAHFRFSDQPE